jgi:hypothetical protein
MKKPWMVVLAIVVCCAVTGGAVFLLTTGTDEGGTVVAEDPEAVELPPPDREEVPEGTDVLAGAAALVATFRELSQPLLDITANTPAGQREEICDAVAEDLGDQVDPGELLEAALAIPDPTLSELAVNDRTARSDLLVACLDGDAEGLEAGLDQVASIDVLFERRIEEL